MNGFLCVTMTAALSGEREWSEVLAADRQHSLCVCVNVYTEKLLRNVRMHAKDKEFESH